MNKLYGVIYKHTNKLNNKVYIGQTIQINNLERRFRHKDSTHNSYKSCVAFFNALNKYGWDNFETEIIYSSFDQESLNQAEEYFINFYNSLAPNGYNSVMMVDGSVKFIDEIKQKISASRKAYYSRLEKKPVAVNKKEHIFIDGIECKECAKCKEVKPLVNFGNASDRWDKLHPYCKPCNNKKRSQYKYEKLSDEDFKKSYKNRQKAVSAGVIASYEKNPELRAKKAKEKSKPIIATHIETGESIEFESAKSAKQYGFDNTNIGVAIKNNKPYKKHMWRFK